MTEKIERAVLRNPARVPGEFTELELKYREILAADQFQSPSIYREKTYEYRIQVLRLGDVAIVGLPGEPFVEAGLEIKLASPAALTLVVHLPSWPDPSYLPTARAFERGGYETLSHVCRLAPGALETITAEAIDLLKEMFAK